MKIIEDISNSDVLAVESVFRNLLEREMERKHIQWDSTYSTDEMPEGVVMSLTVSLRRTRKED